MKPKACELAGNVCGVATDLDLCSCACWSRLAFLAHRELQFACTVCFVVDRRFIETHGAVLPEEWHASLCFPLREYSTERDLP